MAKKSEKKKGKERKRAKAKPLEKKDSLLNFKLKKDPWMVATLALVVLTGLSVIFNWNITGFFAAPKPTPGTGLEAFVVSYCPFGVQMQRILEQVVPVMGSDIPITIRYIGDVVNDQVTAMHGEREATENLRQICIREEQGDKYWNYVGCFIKAGDVESCLVSAGINQNMLESCMSNPEHGVEYAKVDFELEHAAWEKCTTCRGPTLASPQLTFNGELVSEFDYSGRTAEGIDYGGRTAEAIKQLICASFEVEPASCSEQLPTEQAATSFSETYSQSGSTGGSGSC